ncbi:unnamed protein product [Caenorhabditis auriculariae]|uniref:Secreted protein n=1 Tax=Caenorhabditis auriculariae TaxID=2777116 RepID=A0A8S1H605_9PELO|nr:unnamed protein product [Caenorhabditis auriculariae]
MTLHATVAHFISFRYPKSRTSAIMSGNSSTPLLLTITVALAALAAVSADCGCGPQCVNYADASRCTRCCTATVKRSLFLPKEKPRRHHFLLPPDDSGAIKTPMWLQNFSASRPKSHRTHRHRHARKRRVSRSLQPLLLTNILKLLDDH